MELLINIFLVQTLLLHKRHYKQCCGSEFGQIRIQDSVPRMIRNLKYYWMNILDNFASLLFLFSYLCRQTSSVCPRALEPDPVRIIMDQGWFSGSRTLMEHLTQKIRKQKEDLPRKFIQLYFEYPSQIRTSSSGPKH